MRYSYAASVALVFAILVLYVWTVSGISQFYPEYPGFIELGIMVPPTAVHIAHSVFPVLFLMIVAAMSFILVRSARTGRLGRVSFTALVLCFGILAAFGVVFLWALLWITNASKFG